MAFLLYINILEGGGWWCGTERKKGAWAAIVMRMEQYTKGKGLIGLGARGVSSGCNIGWQSRRDWGTALFTTQEIYLLMRWSSLLPLMFFVITLSWIAVTVECMQDEQRRLVNATSLRLKWTLIASELGVGDRLSLINFFFDCLYLNTIARYRLAFGYIKTWRCRVRCHSKWWTIASKVCFVRLLCWQKEKLTPSSFLLHVCGILSEIKKERLKRERRVGGRVCCCGNQPSKRRLLSVYSSLFPRRLYHLFVCLSKLYNIYRIYIYIINSI